MFIYTSSISPCFTPHDLPTLCRHGVPLASLFGVSTSAITAWSKWPGLVEPVLIEDRFKTKRVKRNLGVCVFCVGGVVMSGQEWNCERTFAKDSNYSIYYIYMSIRIYIYTYYPLYICNYIYMYIYIYILYVHCTKVLSLPGTRIPKDGRWRVAQQSPRDSCLLKGQLKVSNVMGVMDKHIMRMLWTCHFFKWIRINKKISWSLKRCRETSNHHLKVRFCKMIFFLDYEQLPLLSMIKHYCILTISNHY